MRLIAHFCNRSPQGMGVGVGVGVGGTGGGCSIIPAIFSMSLELVEKIL